MTRPSEGPGVLPPGWRGTSDPDRGVLLSARSPVAGASGVVPLARLEVTPVAGSLHAWRERDLRATTLRRTDFELHAEEDLELAGGAVSYRRFGYRRGDDDLVCVQWAWLVGGCGHTLTCTVGRGDYAELADTFEAIAASCYPSPREARSSRSATA
jgi:hypothetical protein